MMHRPPSRRERMRRGERGERGDTLVELLIAVVIISLAVGPLLGALIEAITSSVQHRSLATADALLKSFAETAEAQIELSPNTASPSAPHFTDCATNYPILARPSPTAAAAGSAVSVFATGLGASLALTQFTVTVGGATAATLPAQSQAQSDARGDIEITVKVPALSTTATPKLLSVTEGGLSATSVAGTGLTITDNLPVVTPSPYAHDTLAVTSITYWNPTTGAFQPTCIRGSDLQKVSLRAAVPGVGSDTLTFPLRNPSYLAPPVPTPLVRVTGRNIARPASGSATLQFTATVTSAATNPRPTATVTWTIRRPDGTTSSCTTETQGPGSGPTTEVATCKLTVTSTSTFGIYVATAHYPGDAFNTAATGTGSAGVYAPNGSGTMSVTTAPAPVVAASTANTLTFTYTAATGGLSSGQVDLSVPPGWSAPSATSASPGFTTASGGSGSDALSITSSASGATIHVTGIFLAARQVLTITYRDATSPTTTGPSTFTATEASVGHTATLQPLGTSPTVNVVFPVVGAATTTGTSLSVPGFSMAPSTGYLVVAFTHSGAGESAAISSAGFSTAPAFTQIGTQQNIHATAEHEWAWYSMGGAGTGTITITFHDTTSQAYLEVVTLSGAAAPPVVTAAAGFHALTTGTATNSATASLSASPANAADPEVVLLGTEANLSTAPALGGNTVIAFAHASGGSIALYTGQVRQTQAISLPVTTWWGTIALEING